mmetsp:Transcript_16957/g.34607  ORF Transcript_16957/g.34607 Transcript_16957/m.34607 type:complete len:140 (+) Transcript_16957:676-1095(+)
MKTNMVSATLTALCMSSEFRWRSQLQHFTLRNQEEMKARASLRTSCSLHRKAAPALSIINGVWAAFLSKVLHNLHTSSSRRSAACNVPTIADSNVALQPARVSDCANWPSDVPSSKRDLARGTWNAAHRGRRKRRDQMP